MKNLVYLFLLVLVSGCSFLKTELTPEEKAQHVRDAKVIKETVVTPVYHLIRESCIYNMNNGHWPERNEDVASSGSFDHLEVISKDENEYKLNIKINSIQGTADLSIIKHDLGEFEKPYGVSLMARFPSGGMNVKRHFSCTNNELSDGDLMDFSLHMTSMLKLYKAIDESKLRKQEATIAEQGLKFAGKIALCMLLKLDPSSCK
ncbi:MAG: hypothetical protein ACJAR3_002220 [Roseivirga sp.]|jgi:hypothetical protein